MRWPRAWFALLAVAPLWACGGRTSLDAPSGVAGRAGGLAGTGGAGNVGCQNGDLTTISGKVYDPAGRNPVYNVMVYVPSQTLAPVPHGVSCGQCGSPSGSPMAVALTETDGSFRLAGVAGGTDIPLVMQTGKWRRQIKIPMVKACRDNAVDADLTRLPKNRSDGDAGTVSLPRIALTAGLADRLQCLLLRMGVDASEFTNPGQGGSISMYRLAHDSGACIGYDGSSEIYPDASTSLWDSQAHLDPYDMILLNCGGDKESSAPDADNTFISHPGAVDRMKAYVDGGGRVFAEHYHWAWIASFAGYPSPFGDVASWSPFLGTGPIGQAPRDARVDVSFPKGAAFADWLLAVSASSTRGRLTISERVGHAVIDHIRPVSQRWIYEPASLSDPTGTAAYAHYLSFDAPIGAPATQQCGRFMYTSLHVADAAADPGDNFASEEARFPKCCNANAELTAQEKALEFMLFDLGSCEGSQTDGRTPSP